MFNPMPPEKGQLEQSGHALSKAGSAGRRALCKRDGVQVRKVLKRTKQSRMGKRKSKMSEATTEEEFKPQSGGVRTRLVRWQSSGHSSAPRGGNQRGFHQFESDFR